ncbi:fatty acid synthase alpha subunit Lsd1, partial [Coemansia sp. RSA 2611]
MTRRSTIVEIGQDASTIRLCAPANLVDEIQNLANSFDANPDQSATAIELYARFLLHCVQSNQDAALAVLCVMCQEFDLPATNIHTVVQQQALDEPAARLVLKSYYSLWNFDAARCCYIDSSQPLPALFSDNYVRLMAVFGGQPGSTRYLDEGRWLLDVYTPLLSDFVANMSAFLEQQSQDERLAVATGHSQGVVVAVALSMLTDEQSLYEIGAKSLGILMLVGAVPCIAHPWYMPYNGDSSVALPVEVGFPRPMVSIRGISRAVLESLLAEFNSSLPSSDEHVYLSVVNTCSQFIVSGPIESSVELVAFLRMRSAQPNADQSKVPFEKRKPVISASYIDIIAPYHSVHLNDAADMACKIAHSKGWELDPRKMELLIRTCDDGHDIRDEADLVRYLFYSTCVLPVNWPQAIAAPGVTHIVDFGPGSFSNFGQLILQNVEGRGIPVICASTLRLPQANTALGAKANMYWRELADVTTAPNWLAKFGPQLVRIGNGGPIHIDTRMHHILGAPTVMVAGMTPTTANKRLVAAISTAGYHAELAGGGMNDERDMIEKIQALAATINPGQGITLNCIYMNQRQWNFQFSTLLRLRSEGVPIVGLCIGGGVPSFERALEIIDALRAAGVRHMSFKPSSASAIRNVVHIAQACGSFPIMLQWTGGRAGGHHSFEDFHQPILETYVAIRACNNLALVAGSGFGDAEGSLPYITGDWSVGYGRAPMPFDGILLGSRVMVAKEAGTSPAAKALIVATPGTSNADWHKTLGGSGHGGVTSILTEFGELNHVLATRGAMFIRDMTDTILSQPRDQREALLLARKDEIIERLNRDYMRPWFGRKADGRVVDLEQMTYAEVVGRAVELMYVGHQQRWIHDTHRLLLVEFIGRCERRLSPTSPETPISILLRDVNPTDYTDFVVELYPESATQLLAAEDRQFFVGLCKRRGQKPPPFIPVLDADFGTLLQKDTIWQSEDLDSVIGCDPQRVGIQQGPVAAQYSTAVDEPVQSILDGIYQGHIAALLKRLHGDDESSVPVVEYIGVEPTAADILPNVAVYESGTERVYRLPACKAELPELEPWLQALAGPCKSWLYALLMSPALVQGKTVVENYMRRLLRPRPSRTVTVYVGNNRPTGLLVVGSTSEPELKLSCTDNSSIALTVCHRALSGSTPLLNLEYTYCPKNLLVPIHSNKVKEDEAIRRFSAEAAGVSSDAPSVRSSGTGVNTRLMTSNFVVTENHIRLFCRNVKNTSRHYAHAVGWIVRAPLEFVTLPVNCTTLEFLTGPVFGHGQFNMVHLSARIELADSAKMLSAGDVLASEASIASLHNGVAGKLMTITSIVKCRNVDVASITSTFLARGYTVEPAAAFQSVRKQIFVIGLYSATDIAILESKQWFIRDDTSAWIQPGEPVEFCLDSKYRYLTKTVYSSIVTSGSVSTVSPTGRRTRIASVDFQWGAAKGNPVIEYLERHKISSGMFEDGGYSLTAPVSTWLTTVMVPDSNHDYARLSFDGNPIHVNPYVADMAGLPDTITHGLWTSASTRSIVEQVAAGGFPERIRVFQSEFTGMVLPSDNLATELFHVGMKSGRMLVKGTTSKVGGGPVLAVEAEIDQPRTAYVFTGQGSQHVEMGMVLYRQSPAARGVWDRANNHMLITYGVNRLEIVRSNPTEHTVCFLGRAGEQIRHNYLALARTPLLPELTVNSLNFTFHTPTGLLNATQFTQTALVTAALAQVADMRSLALVQQHALFAGHSLGELCALGALTDVFTLEGLLDTVFCRGLIMQSAVQRDAHGSSDYGMVAVNPSRVSSGFGEELLLRTIEAISDASSGLLQIANYNVRGQQYVVSGTLTNLAVLRLVLDEMSALDMSADIESCTGRAVCQILAGPIDTAPVRGKATVPLDGIDMPFHSPMLIDGVAVFRDALHSKINPDKVHADALCQRYIPNLTAKPFELSKEYLELVYDATRSAAVGKILDCWSDSLLNGPAAKSRLATTLLIELLAYQLASPVQWIRTQDHFFGAADVQRVVEIGLSPVLCGMATKTLGRSTRKAGATAVLHIGQDHDAIYYTRPEPKPASSPEKATSLDVPIKPTPKLASARTPSSESTTALELPTPPSSSAGQPLADAPMSALDVIHAIIAFKMKKPLGQVASDKSIKALVAGKSTLQNEILGDLQKEFGSKIPDKAEDMSLQELGAAIGSTAGILGKCTQPLVARMFSSKMPGGFSLSQARNRLQLSYGLGPQRQDALLLVALTMEPAARLATETEASAWLEKAAQLYAIRASISYSAVVGSSNSAGAASQEPAISNAEMQIIRQREIEHVRQQIQLLAQYAGLDLREGARLAEREQAAGNKQQADLNDITAELGEELVAGVRPQFDARKLRRFDSFWNWARQDAYEWIQQAIADGSVSYQEAAREDEPTCIEFVKHLRMASRNGTPPLIHMREQNESGLWIYSQSLSGVYFSALEDICESGLTFAGKTALVTGCGRGSIGADIVRGLLMGGARVLATTSNYSRRTTLFFENLYRQFGARGSELVVVPFNQGSVQDIDSLVNYTFGKDGGSLNWSLDFVFPFAA